MKSNRLGIMLAGGVAMVVLSSLAATAAQAVEGGPQWIVKEKKSLAAGETRSIRSHNVGTFAFRLLGLKSYAKPQP
jgi:predicted RND superfamily exporter protein